MKGFWNGEQATFKGVTYEVTKPEVSTWWQSRFIGQRRQGIEVTYEESTWIIDNQHGDGFFKVTQGMGSPRCPHKSIDNPINLEYLNDSEINKFLDTESLKTETDAHRNWMKENHPELYERCESLRNHINKSKI